MRTPKTYPVFCLSMASPLLSRRRSAPLLPPVAKKIARSRAIHGDTLIDDYSWLRDRSDPDVTKYLEEENLYTESCMRDLEEFQEGLYREILARIRQTDLSVPYRMGRYWYYSRLEEGRQYPIRCRKADAQGAAEEVTLDLNELAEESTYVALGSYEVSDDGNFLAYSVDTSGRQQYALRVKDLRTGKLVQDEIARVGSVVWAADNRTLFYVQEDEAERPYRVFRLTLGNRQAELMYEERDARYRIWIYRSSDRQYILFQTSSAIADETHALRSAHPEEGFKVLFRREDGHEHSVDHREGFFYVRTNKAAKNFRIIVVPEFNPDEANWSELLPHRPAVKIESFCLFRNHLVITEREKMTFRFVIRDLRTGRSVRVELPEVVSSAWPGPNREYDTTVFRYAYQSFVTPSSIYDYDLESGESTLLKRAEVGGRYDPSSYVSELMQATAGDGTEIPVSIVYKSGLKRDGTNPLLLQGYGAYGISQGAFFSPARLSLLDRGVVYAIAHVRGGGEMGEQWRDDGRMLQKKNSFTDFIACAEHLIRQRLTSPGRLAIQGVSAGGLLVGAVLNMRPDLFKAAHMAVPFVDVLNTMLDETLPLTVSEYLEWGNPNVKHEYEYIKSYCPYTNIESRDYPAILITSSLNDGQVMYWESAKYTAKMRALRTDSNQLLLKINMRAGHAGASGRYDAYRDQAFCYSFILSQLGITQ